MNISTFERYIDRRLNIWACWANEYHLSIGYPQSTAEGRWSKQGEVSTSSCKQTESTNDEAEEIEKYLVLLRQFQPKVFDVLKTEYMARGSQKNKSFFLNISHCKYKNYLKSGRLWMGGCLISNHGQFLTG